MCLVISGCNILTTRHDFLLANSSCLAGTCYVCKRLGNKVSIQLQFVLLRGTGIFLSFLAKCIFLVCDPYTQGCMQPTALNTISQPPVCIYTPPVVYTWRRHNMYLTNQKTVQLEEVLKGQQTNKGVDNSVRAHLVIDSLTHVSTAIW